MSTSVPFPCQRGAVCPPHGFAVPPREYFQKDESRGTSLIFPKILKICWAGATDATAEGVQ